MADDDSGPLPAATPERAFNGFILRNVMAGVVVFLIAAPLCVGIAAITPGIPAWSGLITGITGGLLVGLLSRSRTAISGPTAGLTAVIAVQVTALGSFEAFLLAVMIAGAIQIVLGLLRTGFIAAFFPSSVIRGLLCAVGLILILKQIPHVLGHDTDPEGEMSFLQPDRENTFSELGELVNDVHAGAATIGLLSVVILLIWDRFHVLRKLPVPAPLVVVLLGVILNLIFLKVGGSWMIQPVHLVQLPILDSLSSISQIFRFPDLSQWNNPLIYRAGFLIAIVASLESLLSLQAVGRLDPDQRQPSADRELLAQGGANVLCGLIGGLPMTVEIVRSAVNIDAGGRSRISAVTHGMLLLVGALFFSSLVNMIPLSCLAAILLVTGIRLTSVMLFRRMWNEGRYQFLPFVATIAAIIFTDLLTGILFGLAISIAFILNSNLRRPMRRVIEKHLGGEVLHIELANQVSFLNRGVLEKVLREVPRGTHVLLDAHGTDYLDPDVLSLIQEFRTVTAPVQGVQLSLTGFRNKYSMDDEIQYVDYSTRELQEQLTPLQVLTILQEGNERFRTGHRLSRDLGRQLHATAQGQHPLAVVLSCIDSRTPAELILDLGLGDIFSVRVAGNVISQKILGSMEYGTAVAGAKLIVVMGHTRCGAAGAAVSLACSSQTAEEATGCQHLQPILSDIQRVIDEPTCQLMTAAVDSVRKSEIVDVVARRHVAQTVDRILQESQTIRRLVDEQKIAVVGSMYDVTSGEILFLPEASIGLTPHNDAGPSSATQNRSVITSPSASRS